VETLIFIGGEAGQGIAKSAEVLAKSFTRQGYYVFNYREYGSLIKGGVNFNILKVSDIPVLSHEWRADYFLALTERVLRELGHLKTGISISAGIEGADCVVDAKGIVKEIGAPKIVENSVLLGSLYRAMGLPLEPLLEVMEEFGSAAEVNREAARRGYEAYGGEVRKLFSPQDPKPKYFISGSQATAMGALASGLDLYIAYPMTPATPVLHILAGLQDKYDIRVFQPENEIAVVNAALGASYAGAVTMVGTSGGGFALMTEALSLQGCSEVPLVVYLAMRTAPSTGVPTYTAQGDMRFALHAGHGEFPRVVVAPGDAREAFERTMEAFYLAYKYRVLGIILADKHVAESTFTFDSLPQPRVKPARFLVEADENYRSYEITENGVSPRAAPGGRGTVRATSYEHDEYGYTVEDGTSIIRMVDKRKRKWNALAQEVMQLEPVRVYGSGSNVIVSWGSTKGAIVDALQKLPGFRFVQIYYLEPFPAHIVKRELENAERVIAVENSATCMIAGLIRQHTGIEITEKLVKYDARPFSSEEIVEGVRK